MTANKMIEKYINPKNQSTLVGLISILISLWLLFYFIPSFFVSIFHTLLGNIILLLIAILVFSYNYTYGVVLAITFIILSRFSYLSSAYLSTTQTKESFTLSKESLNKYLLMQHTLNKNIMFDPVQLQKQVTQKELDYFLVNGLWPWTREVEDLYEASILNNTYIQSYPRDSITDARKVYNQNAIMSLLSQQTKEGRFLLNGVYTPNDKNMVPDGAGSSGYNSGQISNLYNPTFMCGQNKKTGKNVLQKTQYIGDDGILGYHTSVTTDVDINNLEKEIPGLHFVDRPCDPCVALDDNPNYSCPFVLDIKGNKGGISDIWKYLWGIDKTPLKSNPESNDEQNEIINSYKFRLPPFST